MEAIVSATQNTSDALGILKSAGTLKPGKKADILIVEGNPLKDISILLNKKNILLVMKDGKIEISSEIYSTT